MYTQVHNTLMCCLYQCAGETDQGPQEGYPVKVSKSLTFDINCCSHTPTVTRFLKTDQFIMQDVNIPF